MVISIPPKPVWTLSSKEMLKDLLFNFLPQCLLMVLIITLGHIDKLPAACFFRMSYPGIELTMDPASGCQTGKLFCFLLCNFIHTYHSAPGSMWEFTVECIKKVKCIVGVEFPGIFTIKNDKNSTILSLSGKRLQGRDKMICCTLWIPKTIGKTHQITESMVSKSYRKIIIFVGVIECITMIWT